MRQRLRALVGLPSSEASREENFSAWVRFCEGIAAKRPAVLVFEDLHWADDALLAFLEHLAARMASAPLLVVATARPELFERAPHFASCGPVTRIGLRPLTTGGDRRAWPRSCSTGRRAHAVGQIVEQCGGNPFYVEQSARLLADSSRAPLPESVQAVIAARLDRLPSAQKALLGDASIVGTVFWSGALHGRPGR